MTTPRIAQFRQAVVAHAKAIVPEADCREQFGRFDLEELETNTLRCPAVRFGVLNARITAEPSGQGSAVMSCAAFVVTEGKERDANGWAMAEALAVSLHSAQMFGLVQISGPSSVVVQPTVTAKLKARLVALIAVEWKQDIRQLGQGIFDDELHLLRELYVNDELVDLGVEDGDGQA